MAWCSRRALPLLLLIATAPASAQLGGSLCDEVNGLPITFGVDWQTQIKPIINEMFETGRCTSCHNVGQFDGDLDLTDEGIDAIYKLIPTYVVPGAPRSSILFDKINCQFPGYGGERMPRGQDPLTLDQQGLIYDWIAQGALGEPEDEAPIPREFLFRDGIESLR